jgi:hypothetical protein
LFIAAIKATGRADAQHLSLPTTSVGLGARQREAGRGRGRLAAAPRFNSDPALVYFFPLFAAFSAFAAARPRGRTMSATLFVGA